MFLKAFKYSFYETIKIVLVLAISIVVAFALLGVGYICAYYGSYDFATSLAGLGILSVTSLALSIVPTVFVIYVIVGNYRDFTSDRAYFIFTIPISAKDLILSKLLSVFLQFLILTSAQVMGVIIMVLELSIFNVLPIEELVVGIAEIVKYVGIVVTADAWSIVTVIELIIISALTHVLLTLSSLLVATLALNDKKKLFTLVALIFVGGYVLGIVLFVGLVQLISLIASVQEYAVLSLQIVLITFIVVLTLAIVGVYKWTETKINKGVNLK